jgi:hypothetical protein
MSKTTILVQSETRKRLREIGRKDQTYDQLINELIKYKRGTDQQKSSSRSGYL